jgi:hypothetical protein
MAKRASDNDLSIFCDDELCVEVPAYLRRQKGMLLFKAPKRTFPDRCLNLVSFLVETADVRRIGLEGWPDHVMRHRHFDGVDTTLVRCGPVQWIEAGFESFYHHTSAGVDREIAWDYGVHFGVSPDLLVEARFHGHGDQSNFEAVCKKMLSAVKQKVG